MFLGCGAVAQCSLALLVRHLDIDFENIVILDALDRRKDIKDMLARGARFHQLELTKDTYIETLNQISSLGDVIVDLTYKVDTADLLAYCAHRNIRYINTASYVWQVDEKDWQNAPTGSIHEHVEAVGRKFDGHGPTMIIEHGANPGLVSHFIKVALEDSANNYLEYHENKLVEELLAQRNFPALAQALDVKVIHIAERDTQIINSLKQPMSL